MGQATAQGACRGRETGSSGSSSSDLHRSHLGAALGSQHTSKNRQSINTSNVPVPVPPYGTHPFPFQTHIHVCCSCHTVAHPRRPPARCSMRSRDQLLPHLCRTSNRGANTAQHRPHAQVHRSRSVPSNSGLPWPAAAAATTPAAERGKRRGQHTAGSMRSRNHDRARHLQATRKARSETGTAFLRSTQAHHHQQQLRAVCLCLCPPFPPYGTHTVPRFPNTHNRGAACGVHSRGQQGKAESNSTV